MVEAWAAVVSGLALLGAGLALGSIWGLGSRLRAAETAYAQQTGNLQALEGKATGWLAEAAKAHNSIAERVVLLEDRMKALDFVANRPGTR